MRILKWENTDSHCSRLFVVTGCSVTLEEVCNGKFGAQGNQEQETEFLKMVETAAKESSQDWILTEMPIKISTTGQGKNWRGTSVLWARRREWKNRKFAGSGQTLPLLSLLK
jgi:hypothetical protein